jgi:hypothetical protein
MIMSSNQTENINVIQKEHQVEKQAGSIIRQEAGFYEESEKRVWAVNLINFQTVFLTYILCVIKILLDYLLFLYLIQLDE